MKAKLFLFFFTFLVLSPTLLNEGILWDDLYLVSAWERNDPYFLVRYFSKLGMPWQGWLHYALYYLPDPIHWYKFFSVISWSVCSVLTYELLRVVPQFTQKDRFNITLMASLFPGFNLWFSVIQMPQPLYVAIFLGGCLLYLTGTSESKLHKRVLGLLLIVPTFALQSLYVFLYGLLALWFWHTRPRQTGLIQAAWQFFLKHYVVTIFPVVQFIALKILFPIDTIFSTYNTMNFEKVIIRVLMSFSMPIYSIPVEVWRVFSNDVLLFVALLAVSILLSTMATRYIKSHEGSEELRKDLWLKVMKSAIFLAICGIFPYALVGKPWAGINYSGRFSMLLAWPTALLLYGLIQHRLSSRMALRRIWVTVICSLFCLLIFKDEILWQTRYIKYMSIVRNLEEKSSEVQPFVFFEDNTTIGKPAELIYFELNWIMNQSWGNPDHFGFSPHKKNRATIFEEIEEMHYYDRLQYPFFQELMLFSNEAVPYQKQVATHVNISDGVFDSNLLLWLKWTFGSSEKKSAILEKLVNVKIEDVKKP